MHHPHEAFDFGSELDTEHHRYRTEESYYNPHQEEFYYSNGMPTENKGAFDNVLEDNDPAICFVKAYARKPLGVPVKKSTQASNAMDRDWEDDWYDDEYDNYGDYSDFSDSEGDYYDEEDNSSDEDENDEDSSEDDSSEEDSDANEFDAYDFNSWADHKGGH